MFVILVKATNIMLPLVLKEVINSMICDPKKEKNDWLVDFSDKKCRTNEEIYILIGIYAATKFLTDICNNIREWPFAHLTAKVEISIAHDVYDHI